MLRQVEHFYISKSDVRIGGHKQVYNSGISFTRTPCHRNLDQLTSVRVETLGSPIQQEGRLENGRGVFHFLHQCP